MPIIMFDVDGSLTANISRVWDPENLIEINVENLDAETLATRLQLRTYRLSPVHCFDGAVVNNVDFDNFVSK